MNDARSKRDGGRPENRGQGGETQPRDLAELERKRTAATNIARRLSALKQARVQSGGTSIWEHPAEGAAQEEADPIGEIPARETPKPAEAPPSAPAGERPAAQQAAARPHPLLQARAISEAARRQNIQNTESRKAGDRIIDQRAAREWANDQPPERRALGRATESRGARRESPQHDSMHPAPAPHALDLRREISSGPSANPNDGAQPAFYGAAFSALLGGAAARPRLDIARPDIALPEPRLELTPTDRALSAPHIAEAADQATGGAEPVAMSESLAAAEETAAEETAVDEAALGAAIDDELVLDEPVADGLFAMVDNAAIDHAAMDGRAADGATEDSAASWSPDDAGDRQAAADAAGIADDVAIDRVAPQMAEAVGPATGESAPIAMSDRAPAAQEAGADDIVLDDLASEIAARVMQDRAERAREDVGRAPVADDVVAEDVAAEDAVADTAMAVHPDIVDDMPDDRAARWMNEAAVAAPALEQEATTTFETGVGDEPAEVDAPDDDAPEDNAPDDDRVDEFYGYAPLQSQIAAAAERVARAAGDVTDDREPSLWVGRAPILAAPPADRLAARAADAETPDFADDAAEEPAWRPAAEREATPYFHVTELTHAPARRRAQRAALWVGLVAVAGTAAGAAVILQSPMRAQSDPVAVVSAALGGSAMGRLAEISAPDPQANGPQAAAENTTQVVPVIVDTPAAPQPTAEAAAAPVTAPEPAPSPASDVAAAPVASPSAAEPASTPAPTETLPEPPQVAAAPADAPTAEPPAAQAPETPRPLAQILRAPVPQISSTNEIGAAPVSMPQMPADPAATPTTRPVVVSSDGASPHVAAKLKPTIQAAAASNAAAKPFVSQPAARPAQPAAAKPVAQPASKPKPASKPAKTAKPTPEPIKKVLDLLAPIMNGSKPQETEWGTRK